MAIRKKDDFDVYIGERTRRKIGDKHWNRRVTKLVAMLRTVFNFDLLYLGGGNPSRLDGRLPRDVRIVSNDAGMAGGAFAWGRSRGR